MSTVAEISEAIEKLDVKEQVELLRTLPQHLKISPDDPAWARRGIGRSIMVACERAIREARFRMENIVATLAGEPLYATFGYSVVERYEIAMEGGLSLPVVRMTKRLANCN